MSFLKALGIWVMVIGFFVLVALWATAVQGSH